jgi:hypothetical protein
MKRMIGLTVFLVGCSLSEAQGPTELTATEPKTPVQPEAKEPEPVVAPPAEPPVRKVVHNSAREAEYYTKISVSEGNWNRNDAQAILQTLENMRGPKESLLDAMYRQSPHITRRENFTDPRQVWVSYLPMTGKAPPSLGWLECTGKDPQTKRALPEGCVGTWDSTVNLWLAHRKYVTDLYYSGVVPQVVDGKPVQWGGDMDYWRGVDRGLCPLKSTVETKNTFWGVPKDNPGKCLPIEQEKVRNSIVLTASIASGRAKRRHLIPGKAEDSLIQAQGQGQEAAKGDSDETTGTD